MPATDFFDTPIFVWSFAEIDSRRRGIARGLIRQALNRRDATLSPQVVEEFCRQARERFEQPMPVRDLHDYLRVVLLPLCLAQAGPELAHEALDLAERWRLPLADAGIVAAASAAGCRRILTDRAWAGQRFGAVESLDPFAPDRR